MAFYSHLTDVFMSESYKYNYINTRLKNCISFSVRFKVTLWANQ